MQFFRGVMKTKYALIAIVPFVAALSLQAQPTKSVWDGVYTQAQADRGKTAYATQCASCHAADLTGGEMATQIAGGKFVQGREGLTIRDLLNRDRLSQPQKTAVSLNPPPHPEHFPFMITSDNLPA